MEVLPECLASNTKNLPVPIDDFAQFASAAAN